MTRRSTIAAAVLAFGVVSCGHPTTRWDSVVQIVRKEVVEKDEAGAATQVDFEVEWDPCPGDQYQVLRGDQKFAACTEKYTVGDFVPVVARHFWDPRGYYRWDIDRFGDCVHEVEPNSFGSYEKSQDCSDVIQNGKNVGFSCSRRPFKQLLQRCPWMARE